MKLHGTFFCPWCSSFGELDYEVHPTERYERFEFDPLYPTKVDEVLQYLRPGDSANFVHECGNLAYVQF